MTKSTVLMAIALAVLPALGLLGCGAQNTSATSNNRAQPTGNSTSSIAWVTDLPNALTTASRQNKLVLVDFYTDWCGYCKKLDEETYPDPAVESAIKKDFIPVRINADADKVTAEKYNVTGYPTITILDAKGSKVSEIIGYLPPKEFLAKLNEVPKPAP